MSELDKMLRGLEDANASELYLMVGQLPKYCIAGDMVPVEDYSAMDQRMLGRYMMELVTGSQRERYFEDRNLYFVYGIEGIYRYRCNYFFQQTGYAAVFRPIPVKVPSFKRLKLPSVFDNLAKLPSGMVLIGGPPGCGKTTTLAALVDTINENRQCKIFIVEEPLEFLHKSKKSIIIHREVGVHSESFDKAVQAIMQQDIDVAVIDKLRDPGTVFGAMKAAASGMLVYGSLDAGSAVEAINALIDVVPPDRQPLARSMLAESLRAVVVQDLLPAKNKKQCIPVCEVLLQSDGLAEGIRKGDTELIPSLIESGHGDRIQTMDDALAKLVEKDVIDAADAYGRARDKERFASYVGDNSQ